MLRVGFGFNSDWYIEESERVSFWSDAQDIEIWFRIQLGFSILQQRKATSVGIPHKEDVPRVLIRWLEILALKFYALDRSCYAEYNRLGDSRSGLP
jgi:hypothetical protein